MEKIEVIYTKEKHDDRIVRAEDCTLESAALLLLKERYDEGYWYHDEDEDEAFDILESERGDRAWHFLDKRSDYEYEYVEARTI